MDDQTLHLPHFVPNFPPKPRIEIPRDSVIRFVSESYGPSCQKQMIVSERETGKTNILSQFCRQYSERAIGYFIDSNPLTQDLRTYLYVVLNQIALVLSKPNLPADISIDELKNVIPHLTLELSKHSRNTGQHYYIVIDGIDFCLTNDRCREILDHIPFTFEQSPYILMSCRPSSITSLPDDLLGGIKTHDNIAMSLVFDHNDTRELLSELDLTADEVKIIHSKAGGLPGYVRIIRESIQSEGKEWITSEEIPNDLENLIRRQIDQFYSTHQKGVVLAVEYMASSPAPIPDALLKVIIGIPKSFRLEDFAGLGFIRKDRDTNSFMISSEIAREVVLSKLGSRREVLISNLLEYAKTSQYVDDRFIDLLLKENSDYQGIVQLLDKHNVIDVLNKTNNVLGLANRIQTAFDMSIENNDIFEAMRWSRGISTSKSLLEHTASSREISALIAIGDFDDALRKIYLIPDEIAKIRLLGQTYASMKASNDVIGKDQIDELRILVQSLRIEELDKDVVQDLAIDIFEIIPDTAIDLLERRSEESEKKNILDLAIAGKVLIVDDEDNLKRRKTIIDPELGYRTKLYSIWLRDLSYSDLLKEIDEIDKTRAKEYMLRRWCVQNKSDVFLPDAISLWLDTTISDNDFNISLRSVRQLSELIKLVDPTRIRGLVSRIETLLYNSIKSPLEEWFSIHLSLSEALMEVDRDEAARQICGIYDEINLNVADKDVKIYCYARLWQTVSQYHEELVDGVRRNFEATLSELLFHSAYHYEMLRNTLGVVSTIDIKAALDVALNLNTQSRRIQALGNVIIRGILENPYQEIPDRIESEIQKLDKPQQFGLMRSLLSELWHRDKELSHENQDFLLRIARRLEEPSWIAESLGYLAPIWTNDASIRRSKLVAEVVRNWSEIRDLRTRIFLGFELVEKISEVDRDQGSKLCREVQRLLVQPGSSLAAGKLGISYKKALELVISSLSSSDFEANQSTLQYTSDFITRTPSRYVRCLLFSELAARAYTLGNHPAGDGIVQNKVIPELEKLHPCPGDWSELKYALPVLLKFHRDTANKWASQAPERIREAAWFLALVWQITLGRLNCRLDVEHIKNTSTYPILSDLALYALEKINTDEILYPSVISISKCIEQSIIKGSLDGTQAYDLLDAIEQIAKTKLPDNLNIKHEGYLVVTLARIHATRSIVYKHLKVKGRVSKINIRQGWADLCERSRRIPNLADKVFVMLITSEECSIYDKDRASVLLSEADADLINIPSILDRSDRMQRILETWGHWGHLNAAKYLIEKQEELLNQLDGYSRDQRLERLVQSVYEFSPELAEGISSKFYSRNPDLEFNPLDVPLASKEIAKSPAKIILLDEKTQISEIQAAIARMAIKDLLQAQAVHDSTIPPTGVLLEWVKLGSVFDEQLHFDIMHWVTECLSQQDIKSEFSKLAEYNMDSTFLINEISKWSSPSRREGVPPDLNQYLPGMEGRIEVFQEGEITRARNWVKEWIKANATKYIKIVDPYFGLDQLEFLAEVPEDCKVLIVTTDEKLPYSNQGDAKRGILEEWRLRGKGSLPRMVIIIVPRKAEGQFHCRAIVTSTGGLDIGQSLNGLGLTTGKISKLNSEDAQELEAKYVNGMLDHNKWFLDHDTNPITISIGQE